MMFDNSFYVTLLAILVGVLQAQENSSNQEEQAVASNMPINVTTATNSPSDIPNVSSPRMTDTDTSTEPAPSTRSPRHHSHGHDDSDLHLFSAGAEDWDYISELAQKSPHLAKVLQQELSRHVQEDPRAWMTARPPPPSHRRPEHAHGRKGHVHAHAHARPRQPPRDAARALSWADFCKEAAADDEEPFSVSDGSFHPRFEEVPAVGVYRLHARARSWEEARRVCEREGAQLAVPNSREEALALTTIHNRCPRLLRTHFNDYQYLGVHDLYSEGKWETIVGDPLNETGYMVWSRNQPDNAHHHGENCLSMNRNGFFNDVPCWTELPFICEHA